LTDSEVIELFKRVKIVLKQGGKLITLDGCYTGKQSLIARKKLDYDRGKYVREEESYRRLAFEVFDSTVTHIREDLSLIPYTFIIMEISESGKNDISKQERK